MKLSRRSLLASAAVLPAAAGLDRLAAAATPGEAIALYDPALPQARAMAADARAIAVEGDRIRFAAAEQDGALVVTKLEAAR